MQPIAAVPDSLTKLIIACAMTVHAQLGPGFLEAVYRSCLWLELKAHGLHVEKERTIPLVYRGVRIDAVYRLAFIVEKSVLVEAKSVQALAPIDRAQVINYLKLTGLPPGC